MTDLLLLGILLALFIQIMDSSPAFDRFIRKTKSIGRKLRRKQNAR